MIGCLTISSKYFDIDLRGMFLSALDIFGKWALIDI